VGRAREAPRRRGILLALLSALLVANSAAGGRWVLEGNTTLEFRQERVPASGRAIVGLTVEVDSSERVRRALAKARVFAVAGVDGRGTWYRVPPHRTSGVWLEFLEPAPR
jgi:hypothetical protein